MIKFKINSIKTKIIASISIIIIIFGFLATLVTYLISFNILLKIKSEDLITATTIQTHETKQVFLQAQNLVQTIAKQQNVVSLLEDPQDEDLEHVIQHGLLHDFNIADQYSAIYLMDQDGLTLAATVDSFVNKNYGFRDYFQQAIRGDAFVDVAFGVTSGQLGYCFSHPIKSSSGDVIGVVVVKLKPEVVHQTLVDVLEGSEKIMLVDQHGVVIFSNDEQKLFHSLAPLDESKRAKLLESDRYVDYPLDALSYSQVYDSLDSLVEAQAFEIMDHHDNEKKLLSVAQISDLDFYIVGEQNLDQVKSFAANAALTTSGFVIAAALSATILISLLIVRTFKPLAELTQIAKNITQGQLEQRVEVESDDEIGQLVTAFNQMTDQLVTAKTNVEQKIKERTEELEKINQVMVGRELKMVDLKNEIKKLKNA